MKWTAIACTILVASLAAPAAVLAQADAGALVDQALARDDGGHALASLASRPGPLGDEIRSVMHARLEVETRLHESVVLLTALTVGTTRFPSEQRALASSFRGMIGKGGRFEQNAVDLLQSAPLPVRQALVGTLVEGFRKHETGEVLVSYAVGLSMAGGPGRAALASLAADEGLSKSKRALASRHGGGPRDSV